MRFPTLIVLLLLSALPPTAAAPVPAPPALMAAAGPGTVLDAPGRAHCAFGTRDASDFSPLRHTFLIRNTGSAPLTVDRSAVSCPCVTLGFGETGDLPVTLAPGQSLPVQVSLSVRRMPAGPVRRTAWLYTRGKTRPALTLEMTGTLRDDSPPSKP